MGLTSGGTSAATMSGVPRSLWVIWEQHKDEHKPTRSNPSLLVALRATLFRIIKVKRIDKVTEQ
jgi:hypothetical protein